MFGWVWVNDFRLGETGWSEFYSVSESLMDLVKHGVFGNAMGAILFGIVMAANVTVGWADGRARQGRA